MTTREIYDRLDKTVQDKFDGKLGKMAMREAGAIVFMALLHEMIKLPMSPQEIKEFNRGTWYASWAPNHPLHKTRLSVQEKMGDWTEDLDDLTGRHLQHKFEWFDSKVPHVRAHLQKKASSPR